jgi:hypothetical protein
MPDKITAAIGLALCLALWLGMALGPARRQRLRAALQRLGARLRGWRRRQQVQQAAQREAQATIARAQRKSAVDRDGNVYRPKSFRGPGASPKDDDPGDGDDKKTLH